MISCYFDMKIYWGFSVPFFLFPFHWPRYTTDPLIQEYFFIQSEQDFKET